MAITDTPIFLLVPGAWHKPATFSKLRKILSNNEYESVAIALPSTGSVPALRSTEVDVQVVRKAIDNIISTGRDVILMAHSYGGIPTSEACKYFTAKEEGKGNIRGMIFLCAFALPPGSKNSYEEGGPGTGMHSDGDYVIIEDPIKMFYHDLPADEAAEAVAALDTFSGRPDSPLTTFSACSVFPTWFILGEQDPIVTPGLVEAMINGLKGLYPGSFDVIERMDTGHSPFLSQPENLGKILSRAANEL